MSDDDPTNPGRELSPVELEARMLVNLALRCRHVGKALLARANALMQGRERSELRDELQKARDMFDRALVELDRR